MTGRIDVTLKKQSLKALEIQNPEGKKEVVVHCITAQEVKRVISNLHFKVLQAISNYEGEHMIKLHEAFVWANKELQLNEIKQPEEK